VQLNFLTSAFEDIEAIREYMAQFSPSAAQRFVDAVFARVGQLENFPQLGRAVPELRDENVRELLYRQYRIIY
jgi:plasmid stabilization system protein ParE